VFYRGLKQKLPGYRNQDRHVDVFTADLLAFYLKVLCSYVLCSHLSCRSTSEIFEKYQTSLLNKKNLKISDVLLFYEMCQRTNFIGAYKTQLYPISHTCLRGNRKIHSVNVQTSRLRHSLEESAVENLTAFRLSMSCHFSSIRQIVTSDFQAIYAYKRGLYEKCFTLCESNVVCLLKGSVIPVMRMTESDLLNLLDNDSLSLIGLGKLFGVFDTNTKQTENVTQLTLSVYLLVQCKLRLNHPPATFTEALYSVTKAFFRHHNNMTSNCALLMFAYRKVTKHLR
jgi:hypothetical protein